MPYRERYKPSCSMVQHKSWNPEYKSVVIPILRLLLSELETVLGALRSSTTYF